MLITCLSHEHLVLPVTLGALRIGFPNRMEQACLVDARSDFPLLGFHVMVRPRRISRAETEESGL